MTHRSLILSLAVAIGLPALLGACSSTPQRPQGQIDILTTAQGQPLSGADCTVETGAGSWRVVTPGVAEVGQARGDLRVVCNRAGFRTSEVLIRGGGGDYMPGNTRVGIGVGGGTWGRHSGLGISLGFGFPLSGGSRQRYPTQVIVDMTPLPAPQPASLPAPQPVQPVPQPVPQPAPQNKSP